MELTCTARRATWTFVKARLPDSSYTELVWDSRIPLEPEEVAIALEADLKQNGYLLPTEEEINDLVMGDDEGVVSERLRVLYPTLDALIAKQF